MGKMTGGKEKRGPSTQGNQSKMQRKYISRCGEKKSFATGKDVVQSA